MTKKYNRVMLGKGGCHADECKADGFIGVDFLIDTDLTDRLHEDWHDFNKEFIPVWLRSHPDKTKVAAGLACGNLWTVCKGLQVDDIVLSPNGRGEYYVGKITGNYYYKPGETLPHRRKVDWLPVVIQRSEMSEQLQRSIGSIGTCCDISSYYEELEGFIHKQVPTVIIASTPDVEDPSTFALEKHLEDFLVKNWKNTEVGKKYDIYEEDGVFVGQQYPTDTGPIDILAISKDKKTMLIIELKRGRASDVVIGQIQRYMGFVKDELIENDQQVKG
ncbi:MAG: endonuclease NucS domain-containing protein, partial [Fermentimonas sp.]